MNKRFLTIEDDLGTNVINLDHLMYMIPEGNRIRVKTTQDSFYLLYTTKEDVENILKAAEPYLE